MALGFTSADRTLGLQWVVAVVAGWVVGFFLCEMIQEFLSTFFIDGLVIGSAVGVAQGLVLRRRIAPMIPWVVVSVIGFGMGKFVADLIGQAAPSLVGMALGGAVIGLLVGFTQSVILMGRFARAWWWIAANTVAWAAGWTLMGMVPADSIAMAYAVGAIGAALVGVITAVTLIGLIRHPTAEQLPVDAEGGSPLK